MGNRNSFQIPPITQLVGITLTCVALVGCADSASEPIAVSDWCWLHHRLAPPGALADDVGPTSVADAAVWDTWLGPTADAPVGRQGPHDMQRRLVEGFIESGGWSSNDRERYRASAHAEPTPATICETVGARIAITDDGSLPPSWDERFLDPNDPAHSGLASDAARGR